MSKSRLRIFVFGNQTVERDALPLKILPELQKKFPDIDFVVEDPTEMQTPQEDVLWILDSAEGVDDVVVFDDLTKLKLTRRLSVHDYDLSFYLNLLKKIGKLGKIRFIAVPVEMKEKEALDKLINLFYFL